MPQFEVKITQAIEAESAFQAAEKAWKFLRNDGSIANHFTVQDEAGNIESVDLMEHYGDDGRPEDLADLAPELVRACRHAHAVCAAEAELRGENDTDDYEGGAACADAIDSDDEEDDDNA